MRKHLFVLLSCLFVVMIGFGITLPVLPFYVERIAIEAGAAQKSIVLHVMLLTGVVRTFHAARGIALAAGIDAENFGAGYELGERCH